MLRPKPRPLRRRKVLISEGLVLCHSSRVLLVLAVTCCALLGHGRRYCLWCKWDSSSIPGMRCMLKCNPTAERTLVCSSARCTLGLLTLMVCWQVVLQRRLPCTHLYAQLSHMIRAFAEALGQGNSLVSAFKNRNVRGLGTSSLASHPKDSPRVYPDGHPQQWKQNKLQTKRQNCFWVSGSHSHQSTTGVG